MPSAWGTASSVATVVRRVLRQRDCNDPYVEDPVNLSSQNGMVINVSSAPSDGTAIGTRTLVDILAETTSRFGDRVALDAQGRALTYTELTQRVEAFAARLWASGIGAGDRVGIHISSGTADLYVGILGVLSSGAAYVPVDVDDPPARADAIWTGADVCAIVEDRLRITQRHAPAGDSRPLTAADDAWVIFTSGSTGVPKAVAVTHASAAAFVDAETQLWTVYETDRVLAGLSVGFDASCEEMWLAWRSGAALVPAPRAVVRSGADLGPWLAHHQITVVSTVPTLASMWDDDVIDGVRLLILGGEALPTDLAWRLSERVEVWNTYGPTEATVVSTAARVYPGVPVLIGQPLDGWEVAVVDEHDQPVPSGQPGELVIAGVGLGRYLDPALDRQRYAPHRACGWARAYRTGDIVREWPDGYEFVGRSDDQVKVAGRRIELGEIEAHLRTMDGVTGAAAAVQTTSAGNKVLVGYVTGAVEPAKVRSGLSARVPEGLVPLIVVLDALPIASSGKLARKELPWPPPTTEGGAAGGAGSSAGWSLAGTAGWLAGLWADQLGTAPTSMKDDFFALGGSSVAAAKLVSAIRARFPAVSVADVYNHPRLGALAARLDRLAPRGVASDAATGTGGSRWTLVQAVGAVALLALGAMEWVFGLLVVNRLDGTGIGAHLGWGWLVVAWVGLFSTPGGVAIVLIARKTLLRGLAPGRYPRRSGLTCRLWMVERLSERFHLNRLAGTPWAIPYARLCGSDIGTEARLGTLPPVTGLLSVGAHATLEGDVDAAGWWIDGAEVVVDKIRVGAGARVGMRAALMPGADVGVGAEIEPGTVVTGYVPEGERWAGAPAAHVGKAGASWPSTRPDPSPRWRLWRAMYGVGLAALSLIPLVAALPGLAIMSVVDPGLLRLQVSPGALLVAVPIAAASYIVTYALVVAVLVRAVGPILRPGWHGDDGGVAWALWFSEAAMAGSRTALFPLYASLYVKPWLRLVGVRVGARTEVSTAVGLNRLATIGETSFLADDVVFAMGRGRGGWLHLAAIDVGSRTFLGNSALLQSGTVVGDDSLVGALSSPPPRPDHGTSWMGLPAIELPRVPDPVDPARSTHPPARLKLIRAVLEMVRILLPTTISAMLGVGVLVSLAAIGGATGSIVAVIVAAPFVVGIASVAAAAITVAIKWVLIGRYRSGDHPLWSTFVWRDEIVNTCHEQLAGEWLLGAILGTALMPVYLRAMGARIGADVWFGTTSISEFDLVDVADGAAINHGAVIETHLFHDRLMRLGPSVIGCGATLGPHSAVFPDTELGDGCTVGARSFVMRGERLPANTRWHGAPVVAAE